MSDPSHLSRMFKFPSRQNRNIFYLLVAIILMNVIAYQYKPAPSPYNIEGYELPEPTINYGNVRSIS